MQYVTQTQVSVIIEDISYHLFEVLLYKCNCLLCGIFYCCEESILLASNVSNGIYVECTKSRGSRDLCSKCGVGGGGERGIRDLIGRKQRNTGGGGGRFLELTRWQKWV